MSLIAERANILLGKNVAEKMNNLIFAVKDSFAASIDFSVPVYIHDATILKKYTDSTFTLLIDSSVLFAMVIPGAGQACFDEIMVATKSAICNMQDT